VTSYFPVASANGNIVAMVSALICSHVDLETDLGRTMLWRQDVDRHVVSRLEEARMMALAARPTIVVVDRDLPWAGRLVAALREEPSTRGLSIVVVARGDFDPAEVELLESGANAILRLPVDADGDRRLERLVNVPVRKEARFSVSIRVDTYAAGAGGPEPALALNLSQHGMLMEASGALRVGDPIEMQFPLGDEPPPARATGRVARVAAPSRYGIEFTDIGADLSARIQHFIETLEQA
jgi:PilZ domain-containing protein